MFKNDNESNTLVIENTYEISGLKIVVDGDDHEDTTVKLRVEPGSQHVIKFDKTGGAFSFGASQSISVE